MHRLDPAWLDRQYDNRANVPEHPAIFARWAEASALARERLSRRTRHRLRRDGGRDARRLPRAARRRAGAGLHPRRLLALARQERLLVRRAGLRATARWWWCRTTRCARLSTSRRLRCRWCARWSWTWRHAALYGGDPQRIVVAGHSAGGHLATMMLCCDWRSQGRDLPAGLVTAALSISGLYDLEPISQVGFLKDDLRLTPQQVRRLSPIGFPRHRRIRWRARSVPTRPMNSSARTA